MQYLPLFFDVRAKHCLIVGGGTIAYRKANLLHKAGACLHIVAPQISDELKWLAQQSNGVIFERDYITSDLNHKMLVIAATNEREINARVSHDAAAIQLPVNVVDSPDLCSFILPSIVDRSPLMIAVSSGGSSPVLARLLRSRIESMIPAAYGRLAAFVGGFREQVKQSIHGESERRFFWESILQGPVAEKVLAGKDVEATELFQKHLQHREENLPGEVCLVGAGPGDPDLLTFKALRLLQAADVVLYDRLVSDAIVDLARRDAEKIYVGKARSDHAVPQQEINQLLINYAKAGKRVVRLKGGDPFIFGRGGEEIEGLAALNIPFQVVPGITAASGCASYSGIPLTHRDYAQSVKFVTGHLKNNTSDLVWSELVHSDQTVVFYMGLNSLAHICAKLIEHGRANSTPIALIEKGTTVDQQVYIGTLETMPEIVAAQEIHAPTLIIVGEVVNLHEKLQWFSPRAKINMISTNYDYDLLVIGAGSGGVRAARMAASKGVRVAIAEEKALGGTCVNVGCIPKKLLVYAAHFAEDFADAKGYGWQVEATKHNWATLIENKNTEILRLNTVYKKLLENAGVTILTGRATLLDSHSINVNGKVITAEKILITVGGEPSKPEFMGAEFVINSDQAFYLAERPKKVLIIGGGYIAVEFAGIFNSLGSATHISYRGEQLLKSFDQGTANFAVAEMQKKGVNILFNSEIKEIKQQAGQLLCLFNDSQELLVDCVLLATGRQVLSKNLGLENTQVQTKEDATILVNERFQTNEPNIFALGDVIGTPELTPVALQQAMVFVDQQYGENRKVMSYEAIPTTIFAQPNLATVGLSEEEVIAKGMVAEVYVSEFKPLRNTLSGNSGRMMMKMIVDKTHQQVLGVHIVGNDAGEILQGFAVVVKAKLTKQQVDDTLGIHPTAAEELVTLRQVSYTIGE